MRSSHTKVFATTVAVLHILSKASFAFLVQRIQIQIPPPLSIQYQQRLTFILRSSSESDDPSSLYLDPLQKALYEKELESQQYPWLTSLPKLPFDCTSCGKCCRTTGNVYMSPEETIAAAEYTNSTISEFIQKYASHTINQSSSCTDSDHATIPWILLANRESTEGSACVFLEDETNHCQIYPVRPIQCSTYPFWSHIVESESSWNREVRRSDEDISSSLPPWTPETGGCEGMEKIEKCNATDNTTQNTTGASIGATNEKGIPKSQALGQLSLYERNNRRLPRGELERVPVIHTSEEDKSASTSK